MSVETLLPLALIIPLIGGLLLAMQGSSPNTRDTISLVTAVTLFAVVLSMYPAVLSGQSPEFTLAEPIKGMSFSLHLEPLGLLFATVASGLWILTTIYGMGYMRGNNETNQTRFFFCFAISIAAAMGIAFASNLLTLFVFYEMLTLATYPLVTHKGNEDARRGGRTYLGILMFTSIGFLLFATLWTTDAIPPLAACGDGCTHTRQCIAARSRRGKSRCIHRTENHDLHLRYRLYR